MTNLATNIRCVQSSTTGLTNVQAVASLAVIAGIAAAAVVLARSQQWNRARSLAYTQPGDVFELRARPSKVRYAWDEEVVVICELINKTNYQLELPQLLSAALVLDENIIASGGGMIGYQHFIEPGETQTAEIRLRTEYTGLPQPKHDVAGLARIVFYGQGHTTEPARVEGGGYTQQIKSGAPVLKSETFDISIAVD